MPWYRRVPLSVYTRNLELRMGNFVLRLRRLILAWVPQVVETMLRVDKARCGKKAVKSKDSTLRTPAHYAAAYDAPGQPVRTTGMTTCRPEGVSSFHKP